jgi:PhnB protein
MRVMVIRRADPATEAGEAPAEELLVAMAKYNEELVDAGAMLDGAGLKPSSHGALVRFREGRPTVVDGPFTEAKELVAGYTMLQVDSLEDAISWAKRWPAFGQEANVELELRPLFEISDFAEGEGTELHSRLAERMQAGAGTTSSEGGAAGASGDVAPPAAVVPYLTFDGTCAEAFRFYRDRLGGQLQLKTHGESPIAGEVPPDWHDRILHARLDWGAGVLMGSDTPPGQSRPASGFSVSLQYDEPGTAERVFAALGEGGSVTMPLQQTFWATRFGMLTDRYGIGWMVNCE